MSARDYTFSYANPYTYLSKSDSLIERVRIRRTEPNICTMIAAASCLVAAHVRKLFQ